MSFFGTVSVHPADQRLRGEPNAGVPSTATSYTRFEEFVQKRLHEKILRSTKMNVWERFCGLHKKMVVIATKIAFAV